MENSVGAAVVVVMDGSVCATRFSEEAFALAPEDAGWVTKGVMLTRLSCGAV